MAAAGPQGRIPTLQLFDLIYREETLFNVIKSVTRNGRSILLTALLALILVYLFSIVGFLFLKDDFILEVDRLPGNHSGGLVLLSVMGGGRGTAQMIRPWECLSNQAPCLSFSSWVLWRASSYQSPWHRLRGWESLGFRLPKELLACRPWHSC